MQLGMIGFGRMGANMAARLVAAGHEVVASDPAPDLEARAAEAGAVAATDLADLVARLKAPRAIWLMVPAAITGRVIDELVPHLEPEDLIVDGGNSYYRDDIVRSAKLKIHGIGYVDCGTSGGVFGRERGYCLMVGGEPADVERLLPIIESLAPGEAGHSRTPGRTGELAPAERGFLHCGPAGAGHFVKMVHNGIEYGIMAAYAEGMAILEHAGAGRGERSADAETAPLREPEFYQYQFDLPEVAELWRRGSVISSWLLDLTAAALVADPELSEFGGRVSDSGEGRWTAQAAVEIGVPAHVLTSALYERFSSQGKADYADKLLSAMRQQFGGHHEVAQPE